MVSIDTVYQRVLALANKEQRGYITPQEFNLYANHAQNEIYEQYFFDLEQYKRTSNNNSDYSDRVRMVEDKLAPFRSGQEPIVNEDEILPGARVANVVLELPRELVRFEGDRYKTAEKIMLEDRWKHTSSRLLKPTRNRPIYYLKSGGGGAAKIIILPEAAEVHDEAEYFITYYLKPTKVNWTYIVVNEKPLYNPSAGDHASFMLDASEEIALVNKILQLAGIGIKDYNISQAAAQKQAIKTQQEKQ